MRRSSDFHTARHGDGLQRGVRRDIPRRVVGDDAARPHGLRPRIEFDDPDRRGSIDESPTGELPAEVSLSVLSLLQTTSARSKCNPLRHRSLEERVDDIEVVVVTDDSESGQLAVSHHLQAKPDAAVELG